MKQHPNDSRFSQSPKARQAIVDLHARFPEGSVELKTDYFGDLYLSWPIGHNEAIEVETYDVPSALFFTVSLRAWDRTGGMSLDSEVGETSDPELLESMVKVLIGRIAKQQAKLEAELEEAAAHLPE